MTPYQTSILYRALKFHFTTDSYDFKKYQGKVKYSLDQFKKNKHKYVYEKLSNKFSDEDLKYFFISNFIYNESVWIQDLLQQEALDNFAEFSKRRQSLSYIFENELLDIFSKENHKMLFKIETNDFPLLLKKMFRHEVSMETLIIMDDISPFLYKWDLFIKDNFIWPKTKTKLLKYRCFLDYDKLKFKEIMINVINETK